MSNGSLTPTVDPRITLGSLLSILSVIVATSMLFWQINQGQMERAVQQRESVSSEVKKQEDMVNALSALGSRMNDLADRLQALSLGNTQRFTSLDDALTQLSKRVDGLSINVQAMNDRLVIQEAKGVAIQDELKILSATLEKQKNR